MIRTNTIYYSYNSCHIILKSDSFLQSYGTETNTTNVYGIHRPLS